MSTTLPEARAGAPPAPLTVRGVSWAHYCQVRDEPTNDAIRMSYLDGTLTLMSPSIRHDRVSRSLLVLILTAAEVDGIDFEAVGSTTLRKPGGDDRSGAGKEPDEGIYLGPDAALVRRVVDLDLAASPPPSIAVEVDHSGDSRPAMEIYARLGVREVWIYRTLDASVAIHRLVGGTYRVADRSDGLPRLTSARIVEALAEQSRGMPGWLRWMREWFAALPES